MAEKNYKKLFGLSLLSSQSAYLAEDHLLLLDGRYRERTKRILYQDIEALLICPTKAGSIVALLGGLLGLLFLLIGLSNAGTEAMWWWLVVSFVLWFLFARGIYGKGSVLMGLQTAVQTVQLEGVVSLRQARKIEQMLSERIIAVQGVLTAEDIERFKSETAPRRPAIPAPSAPPPLKQRVPESEARESDPVL